MIKSQGFILVSVVSLTVSQFVSADLLLRDSIDFENAAADGTTAHYEGDVIPQNATPAWTSPGNAQTYSVNNGELTLTTEYGNNRYFQLTTSWADDVDRSIGYTLEFRMRVDAITDTSANRGPALFRIADGVQQIELEWHSNAIHWNGESFPLDPSEYLTYRIAYDPDANEGSGAYIAWINGKLISGTLAGAPSASNHLLFGDTSNSRYGGTTTWDYIRWDTTGAYAPIPEPGSLVLLGIGGAILCRRR